MALENKKLDLSAQPVNSQLKIEKYSLILKKDGSYQRGNYLSSIGTLKDFAIRNYTDTLLGGKNLVVALLYSNGNVYEIKGPEGHVIAQVKFKSLMKKKGGLAFFDKFIQALQQAVPYTPKSFANNDIFNVNEGHLLHDVLKAKGIKAPTLAAATDRSKQSVYGQVSGEKSITKETAIEYGRILNVDPVDLMFPKKTTSIWGSVNTLRSIETDDIYSPCRIFVTAEEETVVVPRDISTGNIRAIKVNAVGSMMHNQVMFYYKDNSAKLETNNKLCIVGIKYKGFMDEELQAYYFGIYENYRGENNLINPDPFAKADNKYILKNFELDFISPVVATIDPVAIKDATAAQKYMPSEVRISQQKHERELQLIQRDYENKIAQLKKEKDMDFKKGQEILEQYNKTQENLQRQLNTVIKEITETYYKQADEVKASKLFKNTGSVSEMLFKKRDKKSA